MHQLILLRHAKAAPEPPGGADHERPLTELGQHAAICIGGAMRERGLVPDVVLVSTAMRTQQTFSALMTAALWEEWPNVDNLPGLYMATAAQIRDLLRGLPETVRSALVIGHNPGLHDLALILAGDFQEKPEFSRLRDGFPTAAAAEFLVATPWRRLGPGAATLQHFLVPSDII